MRPGLVPELGCSDIVRSLAFYVDTLGFAVLYARPEENFAYLRREAAELMLDQIGVGRSWISGALAQPYGRGMNLQIEASDVARLYATVRASGASIFLELEDEWYRRDDVLVGNRQFIVQDPDGYSLRLAQDLGERPVD